MEPSDLVAIMAAIIYSGRRDAGAVGPDTRQAAVEEAWQIWHLTMEGWTDSGPHPFRPTLEP